MQIQILTSQLTGRLRYVGHFLFEQQMGLRVEWMFCASDHPSGAWINYTHHYYADAFNIKPHPILFETGIKPHAVKLCNIGSTKAFFPTPAGADFPFDILAATFYLLSRYEEYLSYASDQHGRFPATASLAYQHQFLDEPIIHHWIKAFQQALRKKFPFLKFQSKSAYFLPTYDIDIAFAYKGKSLYRQLAATIRDLLQMRFSEIVLRWRVITHQAKDPYDVYAWLEQLHMEQHIQAVYFFPVGKYARFDKQISVRHPIYRQLIATITSLHTSGIHFSYASFLNEERMEWELMRLSSITGFRVLHNRFHYLRFCLPDSYRMLVSTGIVHDYSMGYATHAGFRAGIADAYFWYDLQAEQETSLQIYPFCWMDTPFIQSKCTPEVYAQQLWMMWEKVRAADGVFMPVLHPHYFSEHPRFYGYRQAYLQVIRQIVQHQ